MWGAGCASKGGRGTWVDFKENHKPPCGSHFFLTSVAINLSQCLAKDGPPRRDHLSLGGEVKKDGCRGRVAAGLHAFEATRGGPSSYCTVFVVCCMHVCVCLSMCILRLCVVRRGSDAINELKTSPARQCLSWRVNAPLSTSLRSCHGTHTRTRWSEMSRQDGWPQTLESCCTSPSCSSIVADLRTIASLLRAVLWCCGLICDTEEHVCADRAAKYLPEHSRMTLWKKWVRWEEVKSSAVG